MAIKRGVNRSGKPFYNMAEFLCDYDSDVNSLPTSCGAGSTARVVESGDIYILNNSHEWVKQPKNSGGGSSSSSEGEIVVLGDTSANDILIL